MTNIADRIGDNGGEREDGEGVEEEKGVDGYLSRRPKGDIPNSTSLTLGPRTLDTHHLLVLDANLFKFIVI